MRHLLRVHWVWTCVLSARWLFLLVAHHRHHRLELRAPSLAAPIELVRRDFWHKEELSHDTFQNFHEKYWTNRCRTCSRTFKVASDIDDKAKVRHKWSSKISASSMRLKPNNIPVIMRSVLAEPSRRYLLEDEDNIVRGSDVGSQSWALSISLVRSNTEPDPSSEVSSDPSKVQNLELLRSLARPLVASVAVKSKIYQGRENCKTWKNTNFTGQIWRWFYLEGADNGD